MNRIFIVAAAALWLCNCSNGDTDRVAQDKQDASSWWAWHADKQEVDMAVSEAINEPGGGDYAKAADAIRNSTRPPAVKQFQIGRLIVRGFMRGSTRRPPESMEQGLRMMEDSAVAPGHEEGVAAQQLRMLFEHGGVTPPNSFPRDPKVAACWLEIEEKRSSGAARCIVLRRQRLPDIAAALQERPAGNEARSAGEAVVEKDAPPVRR